MSDLTVLAAGSLRLVWEQVMAAFYQHSGIRVETQYGPAGLLRQRIEKGERCDLFASANYAHPNRLQQTGIAQRVGIFTHNQLCLCVRKHLIAPDSDWLSILQNPRLRVATSTPESDPSGDYAWQWFDEIEQRYPGVGSALKKRAMPLVGGSNSQPIPQGQLAAAWLLGSGQAEVFIGYASYAARLQAVAGVQVIMPPADCQIRADYAFAVCHPAAQPLADFLITEPAQTLFRQAGFCD
ncbi:Molybdenum ABC transporter, periplasmic molybdate-binding protein [Paramixta manurensis]|uniref:Molybdenum ABC transporter, periplasmic molybdate-binding protein n=1 Tax=Paramixta manurensis TaxID=2740817 RepID=A0A6M8UEX0_9GAMM|nr:Molybdenum ABC transporter, periplasmic molybdate-binding protein [Erwiniaceae bacterium PD-1]